MNSYQISLSNDLLVDNFAGGGGASLGMEMGSGRPVNIAINHDPEAIGMHEANHPNTTHLCEDVWAVVPRDICKGRHVRGAWFSPDCKHFSKAKGGKPVEKKIRGLAWVALRWASLPKGEGKPDIIWLENVEEFVSWGPVLKNGQPCPERKGHTFKSFVNALKRHGYIVEWKELRACDYGAPTIRKRLFLIARCDGESIIWPAPTHADPRKTDFKKSSLKPWRTAAEVIDWNLPCPSIFSRPRPLAENTLNRVAKGFRRFVMESDKPFVVTTNHGGSGFRGSDIDEPFNTITQKCSDGLVMPYMTEHANASSPRVFSVTEPFRTQCAQVKGGHFALVAPFMVKHFGGVVGVPANTPMPTTTTRGTQNQLISCYVSRMFGQSVGHQIDEPAGTVTAKDKNAMVSAYMVKYYGNDKDPHGVDKPLGTVTTKDRFGLVQVESISPETLSDDQRYNAWWTIRFLEDYGVIPKTSGFNDRPSFLMLGNYILWDIGMRMFVPRELARAQGFPDDYIIDRTADGKQLPKTQQVMKIGNSVCPPVAAALVKANLSKSALFPKHQAIKRA